MTFSDSEIRSVYLEEIRNPHNIVHGGSKRPRRVRIRRNSPRYEARLFLQTDPGWSWGHFQEAMIRAGLGPKGKYDPFRAYRQLERMLPGVKL